MSQTAPTPQATPRRDPRPRLRTVLVCDLVDSTGLFRELGDARAAGLLRSHDRLARQLMGAHAGREIDKSDGFLVLFERPAGAVRFALEYQQVVAALGEKEGVELNARVGIHFGEVLIWRNEAEATAGGANAVSVEGLAKPVAARLASLARPGQVLLSDVACNLSQRLDKVASDDDEGLPHSQLVWADHGAYELQGVGESIRVHEVARSRSELRGAPLGAGKSRRAPRPFWRRPLLVSTTAALAVACVVTLAAMMVRPPDAIAFGERDWVVLGSLVNLTGEARYDGALEAAIRHGLEQSRHVNVLPEPRVRDAMDRMARATGEPIDRNLGSEIAIREGARALVVPTISHSTGRLRVSIEVVDPATQQSVYADHVHVASSDSVVPAVGQLAEGVRERLGEAVASITRESESLDRVTSSDLDALRAYSLGQRALARGALGEAEQHFNQALSLDDEFALALGGLSRVHQARAEFPQAIERMQQAMAFSERLTSREKLVSQAMLSTMLWEPDFPDKWTALNELYPDYHPATHNLAIWAWQDGRHQDAMQLADRAAATQSITRPVSLYVRGVAQLALDRLDDAQASFEASASLGFGGFTVYPAALHAARRDFGQASSQLHEQPAPFPAMEMSRAILDLGLRVDQGLWGELDPAIARIDALIEEVAGAARWRGIATSIAASRGPQGAQERREQVGRIIEEALVALPRAAAGDREVVALTLAYAAFVAAREGQEELAEQALAAVQPMAASAPRRTLPNLVAIAQVRLAFHRGEGEESMPLLRHYLGGNGLLLGDVMAAEIHAARGEHGAALEAFDAVAAQRGRAYAEWGGEGLLLVENLVQVNRSLLRGAELAADLGNPEGSQARLDRFSQAWPNLAGAQDLDARVEALRDDQLSVRTE